MGNSPQFFLNWDQPAESQPDRANGNNGYDWRKHVYNQPGRRQGGAADQKKLTAQRNRQQILLVEVCALGQRIDDRQGRLAEYQKVRQRLQNLLVLQLELLEQLANLDVKQSRESVQVDQKDSPTKLTPEEDKCSLDNFLLADSFLQLKRYKLSAPGANEPPTTGPVLANRPDNAGLRRAPAFPPGQIRGQALQELLGQERDGSLILKLGGAPNPAYRGHLPAEASAADSIPLFAPEQLSRLLPSLPPRAYTSRAFETPQSEGAGQPSHQSGQLVNLGGPLLHGAILKSLPTGPPDGRHHRETERLQPDASGAEVEGNGSPQPQRKSTSVPETQRGQVTESWETGKSSEGHSGDRLPAHVANGAPAESAQFQSSGEGVRAVVSSALDPEVARPAPLGELWVALQGGLIPPSTEAEEGQSLQEARTGGIGWQSPSKSGNAAEARPETEPQRLSAAAAVEHGHRSLGVFRGREDYEAVTLLRRLQREREDLLAEKLQLKEQQQNIDQRSQRCLDPQSRGERKRSSNGDTKREDQAVGPKRARHPEVEAMRSPSRPLGTKGRQMQELDKPIQGYICRLLGHACSDDHECCEDLLCTHPGFYSSEPRRPDSRGTCQRANNVAGYASTPSWGIHEGGSSPAEVFRGQGRHSGGNSTATVDTGAGFLGRWRLPRNSRMLHEGEELRIEESR
ncbi:hypothetical protein CSUI_009100 [Cystoisospora suis]|uniref:Uncharacterized protein n=1 Tax=Cystoisospora suis TaxID=483139 RepID=A0A2C6KKZ3_9APIC|nr:hypothetical protein CSUI_009100 [Cystoisospora suis]